MSAAKGQGSWRGGVLLVSAICAVLLLASCGYGGRSAPAATPTPAASPTPPAASPTPGEIRLDLSGYKFTPEIVDVQAGKPARFVLAGDGLEHTFTISAIGVDIPVPEGTRSQVVQFTVPQGTSGDLKLTCYFHELAGMVGTVRVR